MRIRMLVNVRPDLFLGRPGTILRAGMIYEAKQNKNGAVTGLCDNGEWLGVKPDEFEKIEDNIEKAIAYLQDSLKYAEKNTKNLNNEKEVRNIITTAISALEKQLSGGWIPCKERLPENEPSWIGGTTYIITLKTQNIIVRFAKYKESKWIGDFGKIMSDDDVIAWQLLPKPYKENEV